jgi:hypothetical protein
MTHWDTRVDLRGADPSAIRAYHSVVTSVGEKGAARNYASERSTIAAPSRITSPSANSRAGIMRNFARGNTTSS